MMIDAVMYGMMPRANTPARKKAPPTNRLNSPNRPPWLPDASVIVWRACASMPGIVMYDPKR